jgi:acetyl esterase/lipase
MKEVPPFKEISNSTVPVGATGLSDPGEEIVKPAVVVMISPVTDGFTTAVTPVAVDARFTVWATGDEVEVAKLASPEYTAVIDHGLPPAIVADDEHETGTPLRPTFVEHKRTCGSSWVSWA